MPAAGLEAHPTQDQEDRSRLEEGPAPSSAEEKPVLPEVTRAAHLRGGNTRAVLKIRDRLGCPPVDTPACPRIFMLLGAGAPAWLRAVPRSCPQDLGEGHLLDVDLLEARVGGQREVLDPVADAAQRRAEKRQLGP